MKKELVLLGSMVAMSAALSSCCCNRVANKAYQESQQKLYETAPEIVNYKDGGATYTPTVRAVQQPVPAYQQPTVRYNRCAQVQPRVNYVQAEANPVHPAMAVAGVNAAVAAHAHTQNMSFRSSAYNTQGGYSTGSGDRVYGYEYNDLDCDHAPHPGCSHPTLIRKNGCPVVPTVTQPCLYR